MIMVVEVFGIVYEMDCYSGCIFVLMWDGGVEILFWGIFGNYELEDFLCGIDVGFGVVWGSLFNG